MKLLVTRTASQTEQGKLIKTIAFNEERMNITTKDSVFFLFIMFIVATVSSVYAFHRGYKNKVCRITRLILETLMIFTSVIPPDLPSELSMCIGNAIRTLRNQSKVFSTEPYRILNAGRVKFICFDKSGTLTQSNIKVLGVDETLAEPNVKTISSRVTSKNELIDCTDVSRMVIAGCQSISQLKDQLIGDILEINAFKAIGGKADAEHLVYGFGSQKYKVVKRHFFNSSIKRMSVVIQNQQSKKYYLVSKGSPETIQKLLASVPKNYTANLQAYTKKGFRVLTLAYKQIEESEIELSRDDLEQKLQFVGLLVCQTPLKKESAESIEILKNSDHRIKVISGDHVINVAISA